jgi:hypothetical protein
MGPVAGDFKPLASWFLHVAKKNLGLHAGRRPHLGDGVQA